MYAIFVSGSNALAQRMQTSPNVFGLGIQLGHDVANLMPHNGLELSGAA